MIPEDLHSSLSYQGPIHSTNIYECLLGVRYCTCYWRYKIKQASILTLKKFKAFSFKNFFLNVHLFLRERQSVNGEVAEREGDTQSEARSRL